MSDCDQFFELDKPRSFYENHPLIRTHNDKLKNPKFNQVKMRINDYYVELQYFDSQNQEYDSICDRWDFNLNVALIEKGIRSVDEKYEIERFGLNLNFALRHVETRFGDGFFNKVLIKVIRDNPLSKQQNCLTKTLSRIKNSQVHGNKISIMDCKLMIEEVLQKQWFDLRKNLNYDIAFSESILSEALVYYLDKRFSIWADFYRSFPVN